MWCLFLNSLSQIICSSKVSNQSLFFHFIIITAWRVCVLFPWPCGADRSVLPALPSSIIHLHHLHGREEENSLIIKDKQSVARNQTAVQRDRNKIQKTCRYYNLPYRVLQTLAPYSIVIAEWHNTVIIITYYCISKLVDCV